jgi:minor extracellular protease Epr
LLTLVIRKSCTRRGQVEGAKRVHFLGDRDGDDRHAGQVLVTVPPKQLTVGWHHRLLGIPKLWGDGILGNHVRMAILDTGQASVAGLDRPTFEYLDHIGTKINATDIKGHGTACASIAGSGKDGVLGIAPKVAISSYRVLDAGDLATKAETALAAVVARADVDIVLCAFIVDKVTPAIVDHVRALALKGVVVVASAGNDVSATNAFPEHTPHAITVAGLSQDGTPLPSAKLGAWIDVSAPGERLPALNPNGAQVDFGDSSGAAAIVAGVAALILGTAPVGPSRRKLGVMFEGMVRATAAKLPNVPPGVIGTGRINPAAILEVIEQGI